MVIAAKPDDWYWLVVSVLVTWRLSCLVCYDEGPFQVMVRVRAFFYSLGWNSLIECFHCVALWISLLVGLLVMDPCVEVFFVVLAIAGGSSMVERLLSDGKT